MTADWDDLYAERDMYREHSRVLNDVALRIGEALGYPTSFEADPLVLVEELIAAKLQTRIISEPIPDHAMYAIVVRGRSRYMVTLGPNARANWHTDYTQNGFGGPPGPTTFTLAGTVIDTRILRDGETPTRRPVTPTQPPKEITR